MSENQTSLHAVGWINLLWRILIMAVRDIENLSLMNPLNIGDSVMLKNEIWQIGQSNYGWKLHRPSSVIDVHPDAFDLGFNQGVLIETVKRLA